MSFLDNLFRMCAGCVRFVAVHIKLKCCGPPVHEHRICEIQRSENIALSNHRRYTTPSECGLCGGCASYAHRSLSRYICGNVCFACFGCIITIYMRVKSFVFIFLNYIYLFGIFDIVRDDVL